MYEEIPIAMFFFLSVGAAALFGFLAVASWAGSRQMERESYYKNDMLKKLAESPADSAVATLEHLREQERLTAIRRTQKKREGYILGGLINMAVGLGLLIFLRAMVHSTPVFLVGLIPGFIGAALLLYGYFMAPRNQNQ